MDKKKIKVCYITHEPNLTGASQSLIDIIDGLDKKTIDPVVLVRKNGPLEDELEKRGIKTHVIYYTQTIRPLKSEERLRSLGKRLVNAIQEEKIARFMRREGFDIVHSNSLLAISGMKAAAKAKIPYICHIRDMLEEDHGLTPIDKESYERCMNGAACCITISNYVNNKYRECIPSEKSIIIQDGIQTSRYYREHNRLFGNKKIKVLLAGRIQPGKRQLDAIKAVELIMDNGNREIELYIAGGDAINTDYPSMIREYVKKQGLGNINFVGFTNLEQLRAECDICLMCSTNEALGRVTIEGMLSGCLVIGADAGATPEIIEDEVTGFLYKAGDPADLAACIIKAAANPEEARMIAKKGRERAMEFDSAIYAKKIEKIYCDIVGREHV